MKQHDYYTDDMEECPHCEGAGCYTAPWESERHCEGTGYKAACNCTDCMPSLGHHDVLTS
jgi:hypothetical protein